MSHMAKSNLIREAQAEEVIAGIEDPATRLRIKLLTDSLVDYYRKEPTRLQGSFDLMFFVNVLRERIDDISGLLRGSTPVEYWFDDYPQPVPVDEACDTSPTGLRQGQAFNYAANHGDPRLQAALLGLTARANLKQALLSPTVRGSKHHGPGTPAVPETPVCPFDFLFMVEAVDSALGAGQPARVFFEGEPKAPATHRDPLLT
jgi:hypothetical protein